MMLASEEKLAENNLDFMVAMTNALRVIRCETDGFGTIRGEVQNGKVVCVVAELRWHLDKKKS